MVEAFHTIDGTRLALSRAGELLIDGIPIAGARTVTSATAGTLGVGGEDIISSSGFAAASSWTLPAPSGGPAGQGNGIGAGCTKFIRCAGASSTAVMTVNMASNVFLDQAGVKTKIIFSQTDQAVSLRAESTTRWAVIGMWGGLGSSVNTASSMPYLSS